MIPAYTEEPIILELVGQSIPYERISFLMWEGVNGVESSEDTDKDYDAYSEASELKVILDDDTVITVNPDTLDGGTTELLSQIAFPS